MIDHSAVDAVLVIGAVAGERGDRPFHLVQQRTNLGGIIDIVCRQCSGNDLAGVGIHTDVQLAPGPAGPGAMLLDEPFARAAQLQSRAVDQQMHWLCTTAGAGSRLRHVQRLGLPAEGRVVGNRQVEAEKADDRACRPPP